MHTHLDWDLPYRTLPTPSAPALNEVEDNNIIPFKQTLDKYYRNRSNEMSTLKVNIGLQELSLSYDTTTPSGQARRYWHEIVENVSSNRNPPLYLLEEVIKLLASSILTKYDSKIPLMNRGPFYWTSLDIQLFLGEHYKSQPLPLILFTGSRFFENDAKELRYLMREIAPESGLALVLFFLPTQYLPGTVDLVKEVLQQLYALDVVPMIYDDYLSIIEAKKPLKTFRQFLLSNINLISRTPFILNGPTSESMFFGREYELQLISERIANTNYALVGKRRIGKTSILQRLMNEHLPSVRFRVLYQDCSYISSQSELLQALTHSNSMFSNSPTSTLASIADIIHLIGGDKQLVILLDEIDKLIQQDQLADYQLFRTLRGLSDENHCHFVLAGERLLYHDLIDSDSPLYNFANQLLIGGLDRYSVQKFIKQSMKRLEIEIVDEAGIGQYLWNFTSGHPNILQRLCQRLIIQLSESRVFRLTLKDIEAVVADPDFLIHDFLGIFWEETDALERLCSLVMSTNQEVRTLKAIYTALTHLGIAPTSAQVSQALERLVDLHNILLHNANGYDFAITAFPEIISKIYLLDDIIALTCESYRNESLFETQVARGSE